MKKITSLSTLMLISILGITQIQDYFNYNIEGRRVCLVEARLLENPLAVELSFLDASFNTGEAISVYRRPLYGNGSDWILQDSQIQAGTTQWTDTNVNEGELWEYQIRRHYNDGDAIGYVAAAINYDQSAYKGQMILAVANDMDENLTDEFERLKEDLTGDGWYVNYIVVEKGDDNFDDGAKVVEVKAEIKAIYDNAPTDDKPQILFIIGHIPLPRMGQGLQAPDGHIEATGARGSDSFYADLDGIFTDTATYDIPEQTYDLQKNYPGDFRWDQDVIPSELEMAFGRVSFYKAIGDLLQDEIAATKLYLDRLHTHRHVSDGQKLGQRSAFYENGYTNSTDASFRSLPALSKGENILGSGLSSESGHNQWVKDNGPFLWYMQNQFVPQPGEWENIGMDALVYSSDQSNWGYGDIPNFGSNSGWATSMIRRLLSFDSKTLITLWTTSAINVFHQAGVGEPLGLACKQIMDHNLDNQKLEKVPQDWDTPEWWNRTHFNFFGDPTLRLYQCVPPGDLSISGVASGLMIQWSSSNDDDLIGYHVYKSDEKFGIYQKISTELISGNTYIDEHYSLGDYYMVRAIARMETGSGVFLHPSQGKFIEGDVMISSTEGEAFTEILVRPNPATDYFELTTKEPFCQIEIINSLGSNVKTIKTHPTSFYRFGVKELTSGMYYLLVTGEKGKSTIKMQKI